MNMKSLTTAEYLGSLAPSERPIFDQSVAGFYIPSRRDLGTYSRSYERCVHALARSRGVMLSDDEHVLPREREVSDSIEPNAQALIDNFAAANRAVAWAEAGGDDADEDDVEALEKAEAELFAALEHGIQAHLRKACEHKIALHVDAAIDVVDTEPSQAESLVYEAGKEAWEFNLQVPEKLASYPALSAAFTRGFGSVEQQYRTQRDVQGNVLNTTVPKVESALDRGLRLRTQALALLQEAQEFDGLKPFTVTHTHSYGESTYVLWAAETPTQEHAKAVLDCEFEPEREETLVVEDCFTLEEMTGVALTSRLQDILDSSESPCQGDTPSP